MRISLGGMLPNLAHGAGRNGDSSPVFAVLGMAMFVAALGLFLLLIGVVLLIPRRTRSCARTLLIVGYGLVVLSFVGSLVCVVAAS